MIDSYLSVAESTYYFFTLSDSFVNVHILLFIFSFSFSKGRDKVLLIFLFHKYLVNLYWKMGQWPKKQPGVNIKENELDFKMLPFLVIVIKNVMSIY